MSTTNTEAVRQYRARNREAINKRAREYAKTFKGSLARAKRLLNATEETWLEHWEATECKLCGEELPSGTAYHKHYDHDHETGKYRGTLCRTCNHLLGHYEKCRKVGLDKLEEYCNVN